MEVLPWTVRTRCAHRTAADRFAHAARYRPARCFRRAFVRPGQAVQARKRDGTHFKRRTRSSEGS